MYHYSRSVRVVGIVSVAVLAGCYSPIVPTGVACPDGASCPDGQMCIAGFCRSDAVPGDGDVNDMTSNDALGDGPPGDALGAAGWAVPAKVIPLSGPGDDYAPSISADELTLYLNTDGPTPDDFKLYSLSRATTTSMWGPLTAVPNVDLAEDEYDPDISIDDKELVYISDLPPSGVRKMTRTSVGQPWIGPMPLLLDDKQGPSLFANDLRMLVSTNTIQEYSRSDTTASWTFQRNHANLNQHEYPGVSSDGLEVYTVRNGRLWRATRMSVDQPFGSPAMLSFGNPFDTYECLDPELSHDGQTMYLAVDRGAAFNADIYVTTR